MDMDKDIGNVAVNVHGYTDVYLELDLQFNSHHLVQLFVLHLGHHIWCRGSWMVALQNPWNAVVVRCW